MKKARTVFASQHWDIDHAGFILQEIVFVMILLLSVLWQRWSLYAAEVNANTRAMASKPIQIDKSAERSLTVSDQVSRWQSHSLLLTVAFLPWTWFFWHQVTDLGDSRYIYTAVLIHVMWGITWYFMSLPLFYSWQAWSQYRLLAIGSVFRQAKDEGDLSLAIFREIQPISHLQFAGTGIAAIASFLLPLIQLIR
jgi:hypothetical protein